MLSLFRSTLRAKNTSLLSSSTSYLSRSFSKTPSSGGNKLDLGQNRPLPTQSRVVIVGGGVIGCSVAYHLAKEGWKDVVVLESGSIGGGTTWHAAGLIGQMRGNNAETQLSGVYGCKLYSELEAETGLATGFKQCGSLTIATNEDRMTFLRRNATRAKAYGIEADIISPEETKRLYPYMKIDDVLGALWLPGDGSAISSDITASLAAGAKQNGVKIFEKTKVTGFDTKDGYVTGVTTNKGHIDCEVVVNCGGQWARNIGQMAGVDVPLHSAEHFYITTKPFKDDPVDSMLPVMRDPDAYTYFREWSGGLIMGGFEPECKPCFMDGVPEDFEFSLLEEDWDHFEILMEGALNRVPALETAEVQMVNGPESFTPDMGYILGEAPGLRKFYVAAGFNSSGIASAGGAGRSLAEWIINDAPTMDLWSVDIRRFAPFHNNDRWLRDRTFETLGLHYQISWPRREFESGRPLRKSALYKQLQEKNACFGSKFGWERVNFYAPEGEEPKIKYSFGRQNWFDWVDAEAKACRESVAIFDQSSFSKFLIQGKDSLKVLQRLCCNDMNVDHGKIVYTGLLNEQGGMESDLTVMRVDDNTFFCVTSTSQAVRDADWIKTHIDNSEFCTLTDVTSSYSVMTVMGPNSRALLSKLTSSDLSNESFPFGTTKMIGLGYATVRAARVTYVGELGWELYVPTEMATDVYDNIQEAGEEFKLKDAGYYAIESLRVEKAYRGWSHDITSNDTPYEAGLGFAVKLDKEEDFIGKAALIKQKADGITKRLTVFQFTDTDAYPLGDEPIYRNGKAVGYVSSACYGHTVGRAIAMGYVKNKEGGKANKKFVLGGKDDTDKPKYEIEINGVLYDVSASFQPAYDPKGLKIKA